MRPGTRVTATECRKSVERGLAAHRGNDPTGRILHPLIDRLRTLSKVRKG